MMHLSSRSISTKLSVPAIPFAYSIAAISSQETAFSHFWKNFKKNLSILHQSTIDERIHLYYDSSGAGDYEGKSQRIHRG